jgi:hypothetical protein
LKDRLTAKEYRSWQRYAAIVGPFGAERQDYNTALIVRAIYELVNTMIAVNTGSAETPPTLEECLLKFKRIADGQESQSEAENVKAFLGRWKR